MRSSQRAAESSWFDIRKTVGLTEVIVGLVLIALAACLFATLAGGTVSLDRLWPDP